MSAEDYIVREVQRLVQVLAQVLLRKRSDEPDEAQRALAEGVEGALGVPLTTLRTLPREAFLDLCDAAGAGSGEAAIALADVLREDASGDGRERARWLYEAALASGGPVPLDVYERIAALR